MTETPPPATEPMESFAPGFGHVTHFTSLAGEYDALCSGAALVDRSARLRMQFSGPKSAEALTGLLTNDVLALASGHGLYAAALTAKGKIIADVRVFARTDHLLVDTSEPSASGFTALIKKFVNPRMAKYADVSSAVRTLGVFGPRAAAVLEEYLVVDATELRGLAPFQQISATAGGTPAFVASAPDFGVAGYDLFVPVDIASAVWAGLTAAGATPVGTSASEIARVEGGRPRWGTDMDEETLAQEANLDALGGISYTKGCYTGQETVARLHFRGHVNRYLRGLRSERQLPHGAQLFDVQRQPCGDVRSSVESPRLGGIAIAMIKRDVATGAELVARWDGGECAGRVTELPFD